MQDDMQPSLTHCIQLLFLLLFLNAAMYGGNTG